MKEAPLYNQQGSQVGTLALPDNWFSVRPNSQLIREVILLMQASRRRGTAHTKGRGEVRGGGRKPWRQKGTGRARHGSTRSPIWVGGGVTHGPTKEKKYEKKINKVARRKALAAVLSQKLRDGEVLFVDTLSLSEAKTKSAAGVLNNFSKAIGVERFAKKGGRTLILLPASRRETIRAFRNLPFVDIQEARNINAEQALSPKYLLFTKEAVEKIAA